MLQNKLYKFYQQNKGMSIIINIIQHNPKSASIMIVRFASKLQKQTKLLYKGWPVLQNFCESFIWISKILVFINICSSVAIYDIDQGSFIYLTTNWKMEFKTTSYQKRYKLIQILLKDNHHQINLKLANLKLTLMAFSNIRQGQMASNCFKIKFTEHDYETILGWSSLVLQFTVELQVTGQLRHGMIKQQEPEPWCQCISNLIEALENFLQLIRCQKNRKILSIKYTSSKHCGYNQFFQEIHAEFLIIDE
ncbi:unnamed protein product (macronuclear) [Paramecium tetraurelia]|uniref:Uncharacterized protein n=1 Tax=Paramecium tetraurelia TaxID=5888 RepID=A0CAZ3_PARTE|nr:uncharacterized protein GSPATT00036743001 [Paramecium tetraurelia]CAK67960.1 unnamed protein product [Paramecium tetraurelia]|eukprot:XP_001435357.1 hypothetical protein (macronuclear) [Paramecium tetraurelia strain d4-2]